MKAFIRITDEIRGLLSAEAGGRTLLDHFCDEAEKAADALIILEGSQAAPRFGGRAAFLDPRFCALSAGTIGSAIRAAEEANAPLQSVRLPETPPAWTSENVKIHRRQTGISTNSWSCEIDPDRSGPPDVWWLSVAAYEKGKMTGMGWKDFSTPSVAVGAPDFGPDALTKPAWGAAEIPLHVALDDNGDTWRLRTYWPEVANADCYTAEVFRTTSEDTYTGKAYTIPGLMHFDLLQGCLVNPADGAKLCNRQALPPLYHRCNAIVTGGYDEALQLMKGECPPGALAFVLPPGESLYIRNEVDVIRYELVLEKRNQSATVGAGAQ